VSDRAGRWNPPGFRYDKDDSFVGEIADPIPVKIAGRGVSDACSRRSSVEEVEVVAASRHAWMTSSMPLSKHSTTTSRRRPAKSNPRRQLPGGAVVVQVADEVGMLGGMDGIFRVDAVLACAHRQ
jgi:hypothetical protein